MVLQSANPLNRIEFALANWSWGSTRSEQMCTKLLILGGFPDATPQAPRGGPDGGKDILFTHILGKGIAACYFPHSPQQFKDIKAKFDSDLDKAKSNKANCFFFFTGQRLTITERIKLVRDAKLPVYILDHDYIVPRYEEISDFIGEPTTAQTIEKLNAQENSDIQYLKAIVNNCNFFDFLEDLDRAPRRFGRSFVNSDTIREFFEKKIIHFYDPTLDNLITEWWADWSAILYLIRWKFDMLPSGEVYLPMQHHSYNDANYLSEIEGACIAFSNSYSSLLQHMRLRYPEAFHS